MSEQFGMGWVDDQAAVEAVLATLPFPVVSSAVEADFKGSGVGKDVFFWEAEEKVLGRRLPAWNQKSVGSCVGHGWARAVQDLMLIEIANGEEEEWPGAEVDPMTLYGGSRVEIGGGKIRGDGSVGAWAAKFVLDYGVLFRQVYGDLDLREYNEDLCRKLGKNGVPSDLEPVTREHPVKTASLVESIEQLRDGLANGYPAPICGSTSRTMKRQPGGWCKKTGNNWQHCETLRGVCVVKGNIPALVEGNSWNGYLGDENNRVQLESGREIILPDGTYLSRFEEREKDIKQRDTFLISGFVGIKKRNLSWVP